MTKPLIPRTKLTYVLSVIFVVGTSYGVHRATLSWIRTELQKTQQEFSQKQGLADVICAQQKDLPMCKGIN